MITKLRAWSTILCVAVLALSVAAADNTPTSADYGRVAASAEQEPMLSRTRQAVTLFRARLSSMVHRLPEAWERIERHSPPPARRASPATSSASRCSRHSC